MGLCVKGEVGEGTAMLRAAVCVRRPLGRLCMRAMRMQPAAPGQVAVCARLCGSGGAASLP